MYIMKMGEKTRKNLILKMLLRLIKTMPSMPKITRSELSKTIFTLQADSVNESLS